jgi:putative ABC transport system permease protein
MKGTTMKQKIQYRTYILAGIRNKTGRNLATIFCFAFIAANIFSGQYLLAGAMGSADQGVSRMGADFIAAPVQYTVFLRGAGPDNTFAIVKAVPSVWRMKNDTIGIIGNVQGVSMVSPQLYVSTLILPELSKTPVDIFGIDPATDFTIQPWLKHPLPGPLRSGEVITGSRISGDISSTIQVSDRIYTVRGRLDPTQSAIDNTVFMPLDDAYSLAFTEGIIPSSAPRISHGDINAVLIQIGPGEDTDIVGARIRRALPPSQTAVIGRHFSLDPVSQDIQGLPGLLNYVSLIIVLAAFPLIALIAAMVAHERRREIGLLRSMGARRNVIFGLIFAESLFLAAIGGIAGIIASFVTFTLLNMQGIINSALGVPFRMPPIADTGFMAGIALCAVIAIGSTASMYPAYMSSRMNPYDAIRQEGQ